LIAVTNKAKYEKVDVYQKFPPVVVTHYSSGKCLARSADATRTRASPYSSFDVAAGATVDTPRRTRHNKQLIASKANTLTQAVCTQWQL